MTPDTSKLLDRFNLFYSELTAFSPTLSDRTTLAEVRALLTIASPETGKAAALDVLDRFLALRHADSGEFAPLADYKTQVQTFRKEVEATSGQLSADARSLVEGAHPVAQLLQAVQAGDTFSDAQWSGLQAMMTKVFGAPIAMAVSRGKLVVAESAAQGDDDSDDNIFLWGDRVPAPPEGDADREPPIVFGAKSLGVELDAEGESPTLTVSVHVQNVGDRSFGAGEYAGTRGQSLGIEGFSVALAQPIAGLELEYMAHVAGKGDLPWVRAGEYAGTRGESRSVEGFAMRLVGSAAASYALTYSAHVQNVGDVPEQSDGGYCGTRGRGLKVEGLTVSLRKQ
ncbi:MAG: hypothetical protein ACFB9N_13410 [Geitlerinemataceae cyanobacterium]